MELNGSEPTTGWSLVAENDGTAALLGALVDLESGEAYTRSGLAEAADVPLKTLHLAETLDTFVEIGLLGRIESDDSETRFRIDEESDVLDAARAFDAVVAERLGGAE